MPEEAIVSSVTVLPSALPDSVSPPAIFKLLGVASGKFRETPDSVTWLPEAAPFIDLPPAIQLSVALLKLTDAPSVTESLLFDASPLSNV